MSRELNSCLHMRQHLVLSVTSGLLKSKQKELLPQQGAEKPLESCPSPQTHCWLALFLFIAQKSPCL